MKGMVHVRVHVCLTLFPCPLKGKGAELPQNVPPIGEMTERGYPHHLKLFLFSVTLSLDCL